MFIFFFLIFHLLLCSIMATAFKPYILAHAHAELDVHGLQDKLKKAGFKVLGSHSPAKGYTTVSFTHPELVKEGSKAALPFGAVLRASLGRTDNGSTELSYCSPHYWAYAMGLQGTSSESLLEKLQEALGFEQEFGSKNGLTEKKLRHYNYAMGMPRLTDMDKLYEYGSHDQGCQAVHKAILSSKDVKKVYELDVGSKQRLIGVTIVGGKGSDATVLGVTDAGSTHSSKRMGGLYGPYEIFIDKHGHVYALRGRFRIAIAFPDLSMGTFMKIASAPGAILDSLRQATNRPSLVVQ